MNCKFCMTGKQGFTANLTANQIINQINSLPERDKTDQCGDDGYGRTVG